MTEEFKEWTGELAKGLNFPENGVVLCTAVNNDDALMFDLSCHIDGNIGAVSSIVELIIKSYLEPLDDETSRQYGNRLIDIINTQMQGAVQNDELHK